MVDEAKQLPQLLVGRKVNATVPYLGTYVASSVGATQPHSTTGLQWVLKTAPGRKPAPMLPEDAIAGPNRKLPVSLSAQAVGSLLAYAVAHNPALKP